VPRGSTNGAESGGVEVKFLGQPFPQSAQGGSELVAALGEDGAQRLWIATAWAKRSGLGRVADSITTFRGRGGTAEALIGIDEGGATIEGLELALETFDSTFVFHDPGPRTFHPKLYVVEREAGATIIVGSGNLTKGGLFTNYEAGVVISTGESDEDRRLLGEMRAFYEALKGSGSSCQELTPELLAQLSSVAYITSEASQNRRRGKTSQKREGEPLFGSAVRGLSGAPPAQVAPVEGDDEDEDTPFRTPTTSTEEEDHEDSAIEEDEDEHEDEDEDAGDVAASWWKRLYPTDAQHPPQSDSNPTGNLRLNRAGHPIDWRTYFRREFFGAQAWADVAGGKQETTVQFHVTINGTDLGLQGLTIDHAPHREAGQNNVPTVLHWGTLAATLRETNYTGFYVILTRSFGGDYRLEISRTAPA
jgi:hypothetical protein